MARTKDYESRQCANCSCIGPDWYLCRHCDAMRCAECASDETAHDFRVCEGCLADEATAQLLQRREAERKALDAFRRLEAMRQALVDIAGVETDPAPAATVGKIRAMALWALRNDDPVATALAREERMVA